METGRKFDGDKPEYGLLPPYALLEIVKVLTFGAKKYAPNNWQNVRPKIRYFNAAMRHAWAWMAGERDDPESGYHHLACAAINLMFLVEHDMIYSTNEDIFGQPLNPETPKEENT